MEPSGTPTQPQSPSTQPAPQTPPPEPPAPVKSKNVLLLPLIIVTLLSLGAAGFFGYKYWQSIQPAITTYEECVKANGNQNTLMYPATCTTRDGKQFTQPLTDKEKKNLEPPNEMANWQTYTNKKFGFEFKYPSSWQNVTDPNVLANGNTELRIQTDTNEFVTGTVFNTNEPHAQNAPWLKVFPLSDTQSVLITYVTAIGPESAGGSKDIAVFTQLLSTFKVTSMQPSESTTNQNQATCANKVLGVSLTLPSVNWTCDSKENAGDARINLTSPLFTITLSNLGRGPYCGDGPDPGNSCKVSSYYTNNAVSLSLYIYNNENKELFGTTTAGTKPWISIKYKNMETTPLTLAQKTELTKLLDSIKAN